MTRQNVRFCLPNISLGISAIIFCALICASLLAYWITPNLIEVVDAPKLEEAVPREFAGWKELPSNLVQVSLATGPDAELNQPYDQVVMRTYANARGEQVMLSLAWGRKQRQEVKVHRPDLCYAAQGFKVVRITPVTFSRLGEGAPIVQGKHMLTTSGNSFEAVAYWIRIGSLYSESAFETRMHIFKEGLAGRVPDGILVRASQRVNSESDAGKAFPILEGFLADLVVATPVKARALMIRG